jgi:copper chaperone
MSHLLPKPLTRRPSWDPIQGEEDLTMTTLSVPDMSCGHCKAAVESALGAVPQTGEVRVDLEARKVEVTGPAPAAELLKALDAAGYPATVA